MTTNQISETVSTRGATPRRARGASELWDSTVNMQGMRTVAPPNPTNTPLVDNCRTYGSNAGLGHIAMAHIDSIIKDPVSLHALTGHTPERFDYTCHKLEMWIKHSGKARLFRDDADRASDAGKRCKLYARHLLLLSLSHKKRCNAECELAALFQISQSTVSRYLDLANIALADILPTARNVTEAIREAYRKYEESLRAKSADTQSRQEPDDTREGQVPDRTAGEPAATPQTDGAESEQVPDSIVRKPRHAFDWSAPPGLSTPPVMTILGTPVSRGDTLPTTLYGPPTHVSQILARMLTALFIDGSHFPVDRCGDPDWRKAAYSGKKKAFMYNTNIFGAHDKTILGIGKTAPGSTHDLTLLKEDMREGFLAEMMSDEDILATLVRGQGVSGDTETVSTS